MATTEAENCNNDNLRTLIHHGYVFQPIAHELHAGAGPRNGDDLKVALTDLEHMYRRNRGK